MDYNKMSVAELESENQTNGTEFVIEDGRISNNDEGINDDR